MRRALLLSLIAVVVAGCAPAEEATTEVVTETVTEMDTERVEELGAEVA